MGISLKNITKKVGDVLGGVERQLNPLDNGRTYKNPTPTNNLSVGQQIMHSGAAHVAAPVVNLGKDIGTAVVHTAGTPVEAIRSVVGAATHNPLAQNAANRRLKTDVNAGVGLVRGIPIAAYQLGESVNPVGGDVYNRQHTFTSGPGKFIFGSDPIPSMQKQFKTDVATHGRGYAMGAAGTTAIMDALAAKGGVKAVEKPVRNIRENVAKMPVETPVRTAVPKPVETPVEVPKVAAPVAPKPVPVEEVGRKVPVEQRTNEGGLRDQVGEHLIDTDTVAINTLKDIERQTGRTGLAKDLIYNTNMLRRAPQIALSKFRNSEHIQRAIGGLSKDELREFEDYANARAEYKNYKKGMKTSRSKAENKAIVQAGQAKYGERYAALNDYYRKVILPDAVRTGRIPLSTAKIYAKNKDYVHLSRDMGDLQTMQGQGKAVNFNRSAMSNKRRGSTRALHSPLAAALEYTKTMETEGWKNQTASHVVKTLAEHGLAKRVKNSQTHMNTIEFREKGKLVKYAVSPEMKRWSQQLKPFELGTLGKIVSAPARVLRGGATATNPVFTASNIIKDQISSAILSEHTLSTHALTNIGAGLKQSAKAFAGLKTDPLWKSFEEVGGDITSYDLTRNIQTSRDIINRVAGGRKEGARQALIHFVRTIEDANSITEKATRFQNFKGTYEAARAAGKNHDAAIRDAQTAALENSINFGRAGDWGRALNLIVPYSNAAIQGGRQLVKTTAERPGATIGKGVGIVGTPIIAATLWNTADPERKKVYENIDEFEKNNNLIIIPPGTKVDDVKKGSYNIIKVPLPPDIGSIFQTFRQGVEAAKHVKGAQENPADYVQNAVKPFVGPVNTSSWNAFFGSVLPQAVKPFVQQYANKDFYTGKQIVPDYMKDAESDPTKRASKYTSITAQRIANMTGIEPVRIDKLIKDSFGTVGTMLLHGADKIQTATGHGMGKDAGGTTVGGAFVNRFSQASAKTDPTNEAQQHFAAVDAQYQKLNRNEKAGWDSIHATKVDGDKPDKTFYDAAQRATVYEKYPKVLAADNAINKDSKDPFYHLPEAQQKVIITLDTLSADPGNASAKKIAKDNPWLQDYYDQRSKFFDDLAAQGKLKTPTGSLPQPPKADKNTQASLDAYSAMPAGDEKNQYIQDHPEIGDYFAANDQYQRQKRQLMGLPQFDAYPAPSADVQRKLDIYNSLPQHDGKKGGNATRSAFLKANPDVTDFFSAASQYSLIKDAQLAQFEGEELSDKNQAKLAGGGGSSYSSYASSGTKVKELDPYAYTVRSQGSYTKKSTRVTQPTVSKPKVTTKTAKKRVSMKITKAKA